MAKQRDLPCSDCGTLLWRGVTSAEQPRCRPCRSAAKQNPKHPCVDCGADCWGLRCRACRDVAQRVRSSADSRVRRWQREHAAPGLSQYQRKGLLAKWIRQGKRCVYCLALATTIDHVLPLVRGGTNHEGNLAPCCRVCNGSKAGWTVSEWRTGKRLGQMPSPLQWRARRPTKVRVVKPPVQQEWKVCPVCMALHERPIYCSQRCCSTANERRKSDRNRKPVPTACPKGHPYTEANRRVRTRVRDGVAKIETECVPCNRESEKRKAMRRRKAA